MNKLLDTIAEAIIFTAKTLIVVCAVVLLVALAVREPGTIPITVGFSLWLWALLRVRTP